MIRSSLYFVAVTPEESFSNIIRLLQQEMCDTFDVCRALRTPPHITFIPPFKAGEDQERDLESALQSISFERFQLPVAGMGRFGKRVIFVKPQVSLELKVLHQSAQKAFEPWSKPDHRPYHPHFTIGYRDLQPVFHEAWDYFRDYEVPDQVVMEKMVLFRHVDRRWKIHFSIQ